MNDRSPVPLDALLVDLLDERFTEVLAAYDRLSESDEPVSPSPNLPLSLSSREDEANRCVQRLGRFEIIRELGRGGGGIVFLAVEPQLRRQVALKVPLPEVLVQRELRRRFVQEARAAAALSHPNIVPVYEAGEVGPICYIASAYCEGPTLAAWLREREAPVPVCTAAELVTTLADAVEHAHRHGVLHRDLKPSNVLLEVRGGASGAAGSQAEPGNQNVDRTLRVRDRSHHAPRDESSRGARGLHCASLIPKLTDFGLAKVLERDGQHTRTSAMIGTPAYMAPEQAEGRNAEVGPATDVHALGVILYELLSGQTPFQADSDAKVLLAIASPDPPSPPRRFRRDLPRELEAICLKCLEKNPGQRYASAEELADDLRRFLDGRPTVARPDGAMLRAWKWSRRRPALAALAVVCALAPVALGAGLVLYQSNVTRVESTATKKIEARDAAERERTRRHEYANHIQGAYQAWQNTDLKAAIALLDRCRPSPGEEDLRGWEWYYVRRLCAGGLLTLRGHDGPVRGVAYSPDGQRLASCDAAGMLRIWDAVNGRSITTVKAHHGGANGVAYSADGRLVATVGDDGYLRLWDTETRQLHAELEASVGRIGNPSYKLLCVAFSADGRQLAAAGEDRVIRVWDATKRQISEALHGHSDTIYSLGFAPTGSLLASGSADGTARVWNLDSPNERSAVFDATAPVVSVAFSPDGRTLATADSFIRLWQLSGRDEPVRMSSHSNFVRSIAFSRDGRTLAAGSDDTTVSTWDALGSFHVARPNDIPLIVRNVRHVYRGHSKGVLSVAFAPQGDRLASGSRDGTIQIWDATRPQDRQPLKPASDNNVYDVAVSADGAMLAIVSISDSSSHLELWNIRSDEPPTTVPLARSILPRSLAMSPNGKYLAFSMTQGQIFVRDISTGVNRQIAECESACLSLAFTLDLQRLAVASDESNSTQILDTTTGQVLAHVPGQRSVAFSPNGRLLATESSKVDDHFRVELWDVAAVRSWGHLVGHTGQISSIAFSADGQLLATGSADGTARLWNLADGTERFVLRGHRKGISGVVFLGRERTATAGADGTVKIWDVVTGKQLLSLNVVAGDVSGMTASADGRTLVTATNDPAGVRRVDLWTAPAEDSDD